MRPTISYIRSLRDVLEIPTREERRAQIFYTNIKYYLLEPLRNSLLGATLGMATSQTMVAFIRRPNYTLFEYTLPLSIFGGIFLGNTIDNFLYGSGGYQDELLIKGVANLNKKHTSKKRNPNDFPESKLALDNFP